MWHHTHNGDHWYYFSEIQWPIDVKLNSMNSNEVCRFIVNILHCDEINSMNSIHVCRLIVNMFHCDRIAFTTFKPLQWRHNGPHRISNRQPHHCLLIRLFGHRSRKAAKLHVTGLCAGNSLVTGEFPAQMVSNSENVSIRWCHHALRSLWSQVVDYDHTPCLSMMGIVRQQILSLRGIMWRNNGSSTRNCSRFKQHIYH